MKNNWCPCAYGRTFDSAEMYANRRGDNSCSVWDPPGWGGRWPPNHLEEILRCTSCKHVFSQIQSAGYKVYTSRSPNLPHYLDQQGLGKHKKESLFCGGSMALEHLTSCSPEGYLTSDILEGLGVLPVLYGLFIINAFWGLVFFI